MRTSSELPLFFVSGSLNMDCDYRLLIMTMSKLGRLVVVLCIFIGLAGCDTAGTEGSSGSNQTNTGNQGGDSPASPPLKVLFIGNSYTSANNLPSIFSQLAQSNGRSVDVSATAPGGYKFEDHAGNSATLTAINSQQWDFVILQNQSQVPGWRPGAVTTHSLPHAQTLAQAIQANNPDSEIIYYVTWGRESGDQQNCDYYPVVCTFTGHTAALLEGYNIYQTSTGGTLALVGPAWEAVVKDSAAVFAAADLWSSDGSHPSVSGSYLAANVLYIALFKEAANGATYTAGLPVNSATYIQQIATATMFYNNQDVDGDGIPTQGYVDDFEQGNLGRLNWNPTGDANWHVTNEAAQEGAFSVASGDITDSQSSGLSIDVNVTDSTVSFWYLVDSEEDYDFLHFYIDGDLMLEAADIYPWARFKANLSAGSHTLTWTYTKDSSESEGADKAWVDNIIIWTDNCPLVANPDQADIDDDGLGDACDDDSDNDGVPDIADAFPLDDTETTDTDNDGIGNHADGDDDGDGLPDAYEALYAFLNPLLATDAAEDFDNDGYSNLTEYHAVTAPDDASVPALALDGVNGFYKAVAGDGKTFDYFGRSVSIDGDTALVGAVGVDPNAEINPTASGAAYIYERDWYGRWIMQAKLTVPPGETSISFGYSVSLHNGTAVVSDIRNAEISTNSGAAYVFVNDGNGNWLFETKLLPSSNSEIQTLFGGSVAVQGDTIIVGAYGDKLGTQFNKYGSAYIYTRAGGSWTEQAKLTASDAFPLNAFGRKVAIHNNRVLITSGGGVYLFTRDANSTWTEQQKLAR
ncbi:MAG: FG-GAP repeat protein [Pseudomonadales bacterium]|nr:FG-GAP repeat protein [Pseudomonadales bacterium]